MKKEKTEQRLSLFSRKELRDFTGWSQMQIRRHLERLLELEYLATRGGRNGVTTRYELLTAAEGDAAAYHIGLLDVAALRRKHGKKRGGK
jgi:hypothetical protein